MTAKSITSGKLKRRLRSILLFVSVALLLAWWFGGISYWPRMQAVQALARQDVDTAESLARIAIQIGPRTSADQFLLATIQRKQGDLVGMEKTLEEAAKFGGDVVRSVEIQRLLARAQSGRLDGIQGQLDNLLVRGESDGREVIEAYINGCLAAARLTQAATLIDGWIDAFPEDAQPQYYKGRLLMFYNKNNEAADAFRTALARQPKHYPAAYLLGQILMQENRPNVALIQFQLAGQMVFNAAPRLAEAKALRSIGRVEEARTLLASIVKISSDEIRKSFQRVGDRYEGLPAQLELGNLELALGNHSQAVRWLDLAIDANPGDLSARHARGIALRGVGRNEDAANELQRVKDARLALREVDQLGDLINKDPSLVEERVRIGELYLLHESKLTGEYWLKTALARSPHHKKAHQLLANLYESYAAKDIRYAQLAKLHRQQSAGAAE